MSRLESREISEGVQSSLPFFSVIIATYNRAGLLIRAVNSLLNQTETSWEALIVDDGSTDDTYARILPFLKLYPAIKYIRKSHSGFLLSRNTGIRASCGKFVTFLDSDDEYDPVHLESRKMFLLQNPEVKFLYGGAKILGNPYVPDKDDPSIKIRLDECMISGTFFVERELLLALDGFRDIMLAADYDLYERIRDKQVIMAEISLPTYIYHHENPDSLTNSILARY